MVRFLSAFVTVLSLTLILFSSPVQAAERERGLSNLAAVPNAATSDRARDAASETRGASELGGPSMRGTETGGVRTPAPPKAPDIQEPGRDTPKKMSVNPLGGDKGLKKDLHDSMIKNTSDDVRNMGTQSSMGLGEKNKEQLGGLTQTSQENKDAIADAQKKKEKLEKRKMQCEIECGDGEYGGSALSNLGGAGQYQSNMPDPSKWFKSEEEKKAAEEAAAKAKAEEEAKAKMTLAEKKKACLKECMNDPSYFDWGGALGGGK